MATLKYWLWLTTRRGMRAEDSFALLERFGTPEAVYFADGGEYDGAGLSGQSIASLKDKNLDGAERILADCDAKGVRVLTLQDAEYPERLRQLFDPPCVLYVKGRMFAFDEEVAVGVVGTRTPTPYGEHMAGRLGLGLARAGALLVSGIAQGLDAAALKGALNGGGSVVSLVAGGVDVVYPRENRWLYEDVAAAGALISENPPGTSHDGWRFRSRNRIISGLSVGVAAVECAEHSGTLITMNHALEQNRDTFAVPGPADAPMSRGTNLLIQRGHAKLVMDAWDILCEYETRFPGRLRRPEPLSQEAEAARLEGPERPEPAPKLPEEQGKTVDNPPERAYITLKDHREEFTDDQRDILLALGEKSLRADDLVEAAQIPARRVASALTMLQVRGMVEELPGRRFRAAVLLLAE